MSQARDLSELVADTLSMLRGESYEAEERMLRLEAMSPPPEHVALELSPEPRRVVELDLNDDEISMTFDIHPRG